MGHILFTGLAIVNRSTIASFHRNLPNNATSTNTMENDKIAAPTSTNAFCGCAVIWVGIPEMSVKPSRTAAHALCNELISTLSMYYFHKTVYLL